MTNGMKAPRLSEMGRQELARIADDLDEKAISLMELAKTEEGAQTQAAIHAMSRELTTASGVIRKALALFELAIQMESNG